MANRVHPTPTDAGNFSGGQPAACNDWRIGNADSMSARDTFDPTTDAGYTTAGASPTATLSVSFLNLWGSPYKTWFDSLDAQAAAKVVTAKLRLELGNTSSVKWFGGVGEYVIDWGPGYRVYLARDGDHLIVLFGGGTKRGQQRDIDRAKALHAEYKARKKEAAMAAAKSGKGKR